MGKSKQEQLRINRHNYVERHREHKLCMDCSEKAVKGCTRCPTHLERQRLSKRKI